MSLNKILKENWNKMVVTPQPPIREEDDDSDSPINIKEYDMQEPNPYDKVSMAAKRLEGKTGPTLFDDRNYKSAEDAARYIIKEDVIPLDDKGNEYKGKLSEQHQEYIDILKSNIKTIESKIDKDSQDQERINHLQGHIKSFETSYLLYKVEADDTLKKQILSFVSNPDSLPPIDYSAADASLADIQNEPEDEKMKKWGFNPDGTEIQPEPEVQTETIFEDANPLRASLKSWKLILESRRNPKKKEQKKTLGHEGKDREGNKHMPKPTQTIPSGKDKEKNKREKGPTEKDLVEDIAKAPETSMPSSSAKTTATPPTPATNLKPSAGEVKPTSNASAQPAAMPMENRIGILERKRAKLEEEQAKIEEEILKCNRLNELMTRKGTLVTELTSLKEEILAVKEGKVSPVLSSVPKPVENVEGGITEEGKKKPDTKARVVITPFEEGKDNPEEKKSPNRINVKITTKDGDYWFSGFNGTLDDAKNYFMGVRFEGADEKPREPVTSVELVESSIKKLPDFKLPKKPENKEPSAEDRAEHEEEKAKREQEKHEIDAKLIVGDET